MTNNLTAVSLFTGAGGMDIGFESAGVKVVFANELMAEAAATYNANHDEGVMVNDDINNVMDTLDQFRGVDLVFGGPPCQGFSVAGKMESELLLSILSSLAESESRSISENNKWGIQKRFQNGTYQVSSPPYGYRKKAGELVIEDSEAETVKWIFQSFFPENPQDRSHAT